MDSTTRSRLHDLTLQARSLLTVEASEQLEGVYGMGRDGSLGTGATLPAIQTLPEARRTHERLLKYLSDERAAGIKQEDARNKLLKEVAFTWLNRLVAFKMMEARKLMRGNIDRLHDSKAFKFYLADHAEDMQLYEAGDMPQDALGEGPRDTAYRHFLLWQCGQMAGQIKVLFDPDNLPSMLFPRPRALRALITLLNDPALAEVWQSGNEETVGWVYQYFNELEKAEVFARLNKGGKVSAADIPAATQLFTPRWIVRALVHNSLGRLWMQMHPDSHLEDKLDYLVPVQGAIRIPLKPVREITLLDPACGTMHFGLVAFDLFHEMYLEELEHQGQDGWPEESSVSDAGDIPAAIVANNLFGIDIDLRALQLSALTLLLKAKSLNPHAQLTDSNLARADVLLEDKPQISVAIQHIKVNRPIAGRILEQLSKKFELGDQLGSLVHFDKELTDLIEKEREKYFKEKQQPHLPFMAPDHLKFEAAADEPGFWDHLISTIIEEFEAFSRHYSDSQAHETYYAKESIKGLRILRTLIKKYDVVCTNPPYLSNRYLLPETRKELKNRFPTASVDYYAAFIERCSTLVDIGGWLAMLTQQSFMFLSSFEALRANLLGGFSLRALAQLGAHAFAEIGGEKVNTTLYVLQQTPYELDRSNSRAVYFRLVKEPNAEAKQRAFEQALHCLTLHRENAITYHYLQNNFDALPGAPWVYWITPRLRELFRILPKLSSVARLKVGLQTGDDFRFLRYWWEPGIANITRGHETFCQPISTVEHWFPLMKGGAFRRWWGNQENVINWGQNGQELWASTPHAVIRNPDVYLRPGITWNRLSAKGLSMRFLPNGFIISDKGPTAFADDQATGIALLGILNSGFARHLLAITSPTIMFEVGQLADLPLPATLSPSLNALVEEAISLAHADSNEDETTYDFISPPDWRAGLSDVAGRKARLAEVEQQINEEVYRLYGISSEDRAAIEEELSMPTPVADGAEPAEEEAEAEESATGNLTGQELAQRWLSYAVGVAMGRFEPGVDGALGCGRFSPGVAERLRALVDADGLMVLDPGHPDDLTARVISVLEAIYGEKDAEMIVQAATGGKPLADYLKGDFFKRHIQQYRKRPIYWLLQSPKKGYSLYAFHEKLTRDRLFLVGSDRYLGGKINAMRTQVQELRASIAGEASGPQRKKLERDLDARETLLLDLEALARNLEAATGATSSRGQIVGWQPEIDDGVLLNLAPLNALMPSWSAEPTKAWAALERGDYDWSHTAMRYWPDRVREKCKTNKSYAIAHGIASDV